MSKTQLIGTLDFNEDQLFQDLLTIDNFPALNEAYSEFGNGIWLNHSLWNEDGDFNNTQYKDFDTNPKITTLGAKLKYINHVISSYFDISHLKMVRVRNLINGIVIPHKDFIELSSNKKTYIRVFIPLEDNYFSYHSDENNVFRMRKGEVWILDASIVHAAINFSNESRKFLYLDFQFSIPQTCPSIIFRHKLLYNLYLKPCIINRTEKQNIKTNLRLLSKIIDEKNYKNILINLSKSHFFYEFNIKEVYDWLISITEMSNNYRLLKKVKALKKYMIEHRKIGERFLFST